MIFSLHKLIRCSLLIVATNIFQLVVTRPVYRSALPNGFQVPHPCNRSQIWQGVGHQNPSGGGALNSFGYDFMNSGHVWTPLLCRLDSDGDGLTNGQELGDPNCVWTSGATPTRTTSNQLSHPGVCEPINSPLCAASNTFLSQYCPNYGSILTATQSAPLVATTCPPPGVSTPSNAYIANSPSSLMNGQYPVGSTFQFTCNPGYQPSGTGTVVCLPTGSWTSSTLACIAASSATPASFLPNLICQAPPFIPNSFILPTSSVPWNGNTYYPGDCINYACINGYSPYGGKGSTTCQQDGSWTDVSFGCMLATTSAPAITCSGPSVPYNAITSGPSRPNGVYYLNDVIQFSCSSGYVGSGSFPKIRCLPNGKWSTSDFACNPPTTTPSACSSPPVPNNAVISTATNNWAFVQNTVVSFACMDGYIPSGSYPSIRCLPSGTWSTTDLVCSPIPTTTPTSCGPPPIPNNAVITSGNANQWLFNVYDTVVFGCSNGYTATGSLKLIRCLASGTWSPTDIVCSYITTTTPATCSYPRIPQNAAVASSSSSTPRGVYMPGDTVTFTCNNGYVASYGSYTTVRCLQSGTWSQTDLACIRLTTTTPTTCQYPPVPVNALITSSNSGPVYNMYDVVNFDCYTGYISSGTNMAIRCLPNGQWTLTDLTCTLITTTPTTCPPPNIPDNAAIIGDNANNWVYNVQDTVTFACNSGYVANGRYRNIRCQASGTWTQFDLTCSLMTTTPSTCRPPTIPSNAVIVSGNANTWIFNLYDSVTFGCATGYAATGRYRTIRCTTGGSWSTTDLVCSLITTTTPATCQSPDTPANARIAFGDVNAWFYNVQDSITFACNTGYQVSSGTSLTISCMSNGNWSPTDIVCSPIPTTTQATCSTPSNLPQNGIIASSPTRQNSVFFAGDAVRLGCATGYSASGSYTTIRCSSSGTWSSSDLRCTLITTTTPATCSSPSTPANSMIIIGARDNGVYYYNDVVTFGCMTGYIATSTYPTVRCLYSGGWSQTDLVCTQPTTTPAYCTAPTVPYNSMITNGQNRRGVYQPGDTVTFGCSTSFTAYGSVYTISCNSDGTWSTSDLTCIPKAPPACPTPDLPRYSSTVYGGSPDSSGLYKVGDWIQYGCQDGYTIFGTIQCRWDGYWSSNAMSCQPTTEGLLFNSGAVSAGKDSGTCTAPRSPNHAAPISSTTSMRYGTGEFIQYNCESGYAVSGILTCLTDGTWSAASYTCTPGGQVGNPDLGNGQVLLAGGGGGNRRPSSTSAPSNNRPASSSTASCDAPLVPSDSRVVAQQGSRTSGSSSSSYPVGSFFMYQCNDGFQMFGQSTVTCQNDSTWSDGPVCISSSGKR